MKLKANDSIRLDKYLTKEISKTRNYIQKLIEDEHIKVNGKVISKKNYILNIDDEIEVFIPEPEILDIKPKDIQLDIVYEDEYLLVINKQKDLTVHPASGNYDNTLVNALMYHVDKLSSINGVIRPGIVHRIDKDTTGLLLVAKTNEAHNFLAKQLKNHTVKRIYYALVHNRFSEKKGIINKPIARSKKDRKKMAVDASGKEAITHYEVIEEYDNYSLIKCELETGRTHQIRVHMSYIKHPIVGDKTYGPKNIKLTKSGQLLHAKIIEFIHPKDNEIKRFEVDLPDEFNDIIKKLKNKMQ